MNNLDQVCMLANPSAHKAKKRIDYNAMLFGQKLLRRNHGLNTFTQKDCADLMDCLRDDYNKLLNLGYSVETIAG